MFPVFNKIHYKKNRPLRNVQIFFCDLKSCFQRIKRGYSDAAAEEMHAWFLGVVPDMLKSYRRTLDIHGGFPSVFVEEFYEKYSPEIGCSYDDFLRSDCAPPIKEWQTKMEEYGRARWRGVIDEMIQLFSESKENEADANRTARLKKGFNLISRWFEYLWI